MKRHTTNDQNIFIEVAEDCPVQKGEIPKSNDGNKSIAGLQYEILSANPYEYTSDDVIFSVFAIRNQISEAELSNARALFFSKGQPCFRASPLTKRYGWGVHHNEESKIAIYGVESKQYADFVADETIIKKKAMRSKRASC